MKITLPKPEAIVLDYLSTAIKAGFIEKGLYAFVRKHGKRVLNQNWGKSEFQDMIGKVRRQVRRDQRNNPDWGTPSVEDRNQPQEKQADAMYNSLIWYMNNKKETSAHYKLKFLMYEIGYKEGKIVTHVYTDVANNLRAWHQQGINIYIYSNAWVRIQKMFMKKTNHGELDNTITGYFDTSDIGAANDQNSFLKLLTRIKFDPDKVIFLTKNTQEGNAAKSVGINTLLVISHQYQLKNYTQEELNDYHRIRSFDELIFEGTSSIAASLSRLNEGGSQVGSGLGSKVSSQTGSQMPSGSRVSSKSGTGSATGSQTGSQTAAGLGTGSRLESKSGRGSATGSGTGSATGSGAGSATGSAIGSQKSSKPGSQTPPGSDTE